MIGFVSSDFYFIRDLLSSFLRSTSFQTDLVELSSHMDPFAAKAASNRLMTEEDETYVTPNSPRHRLNQNNQIQYPSRDDSKA